MRLYIYCILRNLLGVYIYSYMYDDMYYIVYFVYWLLLSYIVLCRENFTVCIQYVHTKYVFFLKSDLTCGSLSLKWILKYVFIIWNISSWFFLCLIPLLMISQVMVIDSSAGPESCDIWFPWRQSLLWRCNDHRCFTRHLWYALYELI